MLNDIYNHIDRNLLDQEINLFNPFRSNTFQYY